MSERSEHPEEVAFWQSFDYDPETNRWLLAPGVAPIDLLPVVEAKLIADRAAVEAAVAG